MISGIWYQNHPNDRLQTEAQKLKELKLRTPGYPRLCSTPGCDGIVPLFRRADLCDHNFGPSDGSTPCWARLTLDEMFVHWRSMKHVPANEDTVEILLSVFTPEQLQAVIDRVPSFQSMLAFDRQYVEWLDYADDLEDKFPDLDAVAEVVAILAEAGGHVVGSHKFEKAMTINFTKVIHPGQCGAMRCKEVADGEYEIDGRTLPLCARHVEACKHTGQLQGASVVVSVPLPKATPTPAIIETTAEVVPQDEIAAANEQVSAELAQVKDFIIETQDDMDIAAALLDDVKGKYKRYEERLKEITKPMREAEKSVRDLFRPVLTGLQEIERLVKGQIASFALQKEQQNKEALEAAAVARAAGDVTGTADALAMVVHVENAAGISTRPVWQFEVFDAAAIPREYCSPDEAKIRAAAVGAGGEEPPGIPGVRWIAGVSVTARRTS